MNVEKSLELDVILSQVEKYCRFSLGKQRIQQLKPAFSKLVINRDHDRIKEALECTVKYDTCPIHGVTDLRNTLLNAKKGRILSGQECLDEIRLIEGIRDIVNYAGSLEDVDHDNLSELFDSLIVHDVLEKKLRRVFNEYGEIMDSASNALRSIRSSMRRIDGEIAGAAASFISSHSSSVVDHIVTYRNGRAVVLIRAAEKNMFGGMVYGDSASGQASYVEPAALVGLNNRRSELIEEEKEEVRKILKECSAWIGEVCDEEIGNIETVSILDEIFAKAQWGKERDCCVAQLSEEKELAIVRGRHPLIDPKKVVANTYHLSSHQNILLITGPNTGGKTVSMKIIGLFVLMTYCGMPVPCDEALIPYFDSVYADIGDDQSVVSSLSSFSAHMCKQAEIIREAGADSLCLLDEIGSGTDPREGEALAISILNELRRRGTMAVITTHYDRLKAYGKRHDDVLVASVQFDMEKLMPTYRYMEGFTGQSNAFEVAQRYGVPENIISYARYLKNQAKTQEDELIERLEKQLNQTQIEKDELEKRLENTKKLEAQLKKESEALQAQKEKMLEDAKKEADAYIEESRRKADAILKKIRKNQDQLRYHEALEAVSALNVEEEVEEENDNMEFTYRVGDAVELKGNSQVCEVIEVGKKDLKISMNGRTMRVKKNQIRPSMHVIVKKKPDISIHTGRDIFSTMPLEVNLIGLRVDEAMEKMGDYMDSAALHGLKSFRIIHGDGTGRLRKAVHEKLKHNGNVKEFRLGMPQEGGTGATIVTMK